ncbi:MAG: cupin domain-containing protein [Kutzneria sp.]|nr:cupin domain-containing protein [Kutzneria sp.]
MIVTRASGGQSAVSTFRILGDHHVHPIQVPPADSPLRAMTVELAPGARTAWHSHPLGQIIIALHGVGQIQAADGPVIRLRPGDAIWAPPGEQHWHGAAPTEGFVYSCVQPEDPDTGEHVIWS